MKRQWQVWTIGRGDAIEEDQAGADQQPAEGVCIDCGGYLLKVRAGSIWLESPDGEGMPVAPADLRHALAQLFQAKF